MFVEETELLELRPGSVVISTENLYRIIELPKGKIVGELACLDEASLHAHGNFDVKAYAPWRVAVDYELIGILEQQGVSLFDIAVPPIPKGHCRACGAMLCRRTKKTKRFTCESVLRKDKDGWWTREVQTLECKAGELQRERIMAEKSEKLRQILITAGATINPDEWWLLDGRPQRKPVRNSEAFDVCRERLARGDTPPHGGGGGFLHRLLQRLAIGRITTGGRGRSCGRRNESTLVESTR